MVVEAADDVPEEFHRCTVRPLDVLDNDQKRPLPEAPFG